VVAWQDWLTPLWRRCAGGCHLNRPIDKLVRNAGFAIVELKAGYMGRPKVATFMYDRAGPPLLARRPRARSRAVHILLPNGLPETKELSLGKEGGVERADGTPKMRVQR
jgi:hypothetical protein